MFSFFKSATDTIKHYLGYSSSIEARYSDLRKECGSDFNPFLKENRAYRLRLLALEALPSSRLLALSIANSIRSLDALQAGTCLAEMALYFLKNDKISEKDYHSAKE